MMLTGNKHKDESSKKSRKKRVTFDTNPPKVAEAAARSMEELLRQSKNNIQKLIPHNVLSNNHLIPTSTIPGFHPNYNVGSLFKVHANGVPPPPPPPRAPLVAQDTGTDPNEEVEIDNTHFKNVQIESVLHNGASNLPPPGSLNPPQNMSYNWNNDSTSSLNNINDIPPPLPPKIRATNSSNAEAHTMNSYSQHSNSRSNCNTLSSLVPSPTGPLSNVGSTQTGSIQKLQSNTTGNFQSLQNSSNSSLSSSQNQPPQPPPPPSRSLGTTYISPQVTGQIQQPQQQQLSGMSLKPQLTGGRLLTSQSMMNNSPQTTGNTPTIQYPGNSLQPQLTGNSSTSQFTGNSLKPQLTGSSSNSQYTGNSLQPQVTGNAPNSQYTGTSLKPQLTGGAPSPQYTGSSIQSQNTGSGSFQMPLQSSLNPLKSQSTGGLSSVSFNQSNSLNSQSFNDNSNVNGIQAQATGQLASNTSFPTLQSQATGSSQTNGQIYMNNSGSFASQSHLHSQSALSLPSLNNMNNSNAAPASLSDFTSLFTPPRQQQNSPQPSTNLKTNIFSQQHQIGNSISHDGTSNQQSNPLLSNSTGMGQQMNGMSQPMSNQMPFNNQMSQQSISNPNLSDTQNNLQLPRRSVSGGSQSISGTAGPVMSNGLLMPPPPPPRRRYVSLQGSSTPSPSGSVTQFPVYGNEQEQNSPMYQNPQQMQQQQQPNQFIGGYHNMGVHNSTNSNLPLPYLNQVASNSVPNLVSSMQGMRLDNNMNQNNPGMPNSQMGTFPNNNMMNGGFNNGQYYH